MSSEKTIREYHLSVNEFNQPKKSEKAEAIGVLLVRLILLEPGTNPVRPDMGLGIVSRFRYGMETDIPAVAAELKRQIDKYLPEFQNVSVKITTNSSKELVFDINIDNDIYKYVTSQQENNQISITELL